MGGAARRFCKYRNGLAEHGDHFAILPTAVRQYEIQQAAFFALWLHCEQRLSIAGEVQKRSALGLVGFVGLLVPFDPTPSAVLFLALPVQFFS